MKNRIFRLLLILTAPALIMLSCSKDEEAENTAPTASFTVNPQSGNTQTEFELDASACSDLETPAGELLVRWDGNDDGIWESDYSTIKIALVTFDTEGVYTIRLQVKDAGGLTGTTTREVTIGGNLSPAVPDNPSPVDGTTNVVVNASLQWTSSDPEQDPILYDVYFGNVQNPPLASAGISDDSYTPGAMANNTTYYWKVVAHDDQGNSTEGPVWSFTTEAAAFVCGEMLTDPRDDKNYPTIQIGDQCWMAKNLNVGDRIDGGQDMSDDSNLEKYCYDDEAANCDTYGGLYQWAEMVQYAGDNLQGICPGGWHLPTLEEWEALEMALGMSQAQATATSGWQGTDEGTALKEGGGSGFNALLGGYRGTSGNFAFGNAWAVFWTGTQSSTYQAYARTLDVDHTQVNHTQYDKQFGNAVRCLKD
ncbi:MAG: FISUMP domain-containing protein [Bacteroidota bacterium]